MFGDSCEILFLKYPASLENKTGLQPVSRPVELVHYLKGWGFVQSPLDAKTVQTVTLLIAYFYNIRKNIYKPPLKTCGFFGYIFSETASLCY